MKKILKKIAFFGRIYGFIGWMRRILYRYGFFSSYQSTDFKVIGIGNLSVGGTGKTPHTEFLLSRLQDTFRLATLSRGYGRKSKGFLAANELASAELNARTLGDEPLQMFKKFPGVNVCVCEKRKIGLQKLAALATPPQVVLLDDNFQHLQVRVDGQLLLTEYHAPYFEDVPLPEGRLREFPCAAAAADVLIVTKCPANLTFAEAARFRARLAPRPHQEVYFSTFAYTVPRPENAVAAARTLTSETPIAVVTGIAHPEPLLRHLQQHYARLTHYRFSDHHYFSFSEMEKIIAQEQKKNPDFVLFSTEKDISRLLSNDTKKLLSLQPIFSIPIEVKILFEQENQLITKIKSYVTENQ